MSRRQSSRTYNVSSARPRKPAARNTHWLTQLLSIASTAGLASGHKYGMEKLEERKLFTTFNDFGGGGPQTFTYYSGQDQVVQISYFDVNFEAVGAFVNPTTGNQSLGDLVRAQTTEPTVGGNLYKIYVAESAADSYISVYKLSGLTAPQIPQPYAGAIPAFAITNTAGNPSFSAVPGGTGGVLLGALETVEPPNTPAPRPIVSIPLPAPLGLQPAEPTGLAPGIEVLPIDPLTGLQNDFGNMLIGGTVTGAVSFGGNVTEFYAGAVLTGDLQGDVLPPSTVPTSARVSPNNFSVAGDLREFLTAGPVGTDGAGSGAATAGANASTASFAPTYVTNFDLSVGGKIGEVKVGNAELGTPEASYAGTIEAGNSPYVSQLLPYPAGSTSLVIGDTAPQTEIETIPAQSPLGVDAAFESGTVDLRNNTPADAEFLDSIPILSPVTGLPAINTAGKIVYEADVQGVLGSLMGPPDAAADANDYYALPLLAGQTVQITITAPSLQVTDPSGRLIASNSRSGGGPLEITADRPGIYLLNVSGGTDLPYELIVTGTGEMGIGGIDIRNDFNDIGIDSGIISGNSDIGALDVGGVYDSTTTGPTADAAGNTLPMLVAPPTHASTSILVANGNLRAALAGDFGTQTTTTTNVQGTTQSVETLSGGPFLSVPNGSVGLIQSVTGILDVNCQFDPNDLNLPTPVFATDDAYATAIGGSIQEINAATTFAGDIATNAGIGTIDAGNMSTLNPSYIDVNADNVGDDGIIDLIAVTGDLGTLAGGGPGIVTNQGGDVRYMTVGGTVYRNSFFGGGFNKPVAYPAGQVVTMTDDAGNKLTITPLGPVTTTITTTVDTPLSGAAQTTVSTVSTGAQITILSYGVIDKGGEIPISINSSGGMSITAAGTGSSSVNVGTLEIQGTGSPIVNGGLDPFGNVTISQTPATTNLSNGAVASNTTTTNADGSTVSVSVTTSGGGTTTDLSLLLSGSTTINALNVISTGIATNIEDDTPGEVASITSPGVGQILVHGNLGYLTPVATLAAVLPVAVITDGNTYPFVQQHTGVVITGSAVNIDADGGIGNVIVTGTLQSLVANFGAGNGHTAIAGQFDGIVGPIYGGSLLNIDIGQGILPTGSGKVGYSGIFATGTIGVINNAGNPNGDIRGNIVSSDTTGTGFGIGQIALHNASIIDAEIITIVGADFAPTSDIGSPFVSPDPDESPFASPYQYEIGSISVSGAGGIIGMNINCTNVGPITVNNGGFGVLNSTINSEDLGRVAGISASGYGIRDTTIEQCGYLGPIVATGNGSLLSVLNFPIDVRESDVPNTVDPFFGITPDSSTDLNAELGTSALAPSIVDVTDTGVVQDCVFQGQENFASLTAQKVRTATPLVTDETAPTPDQVNIPQKGVDFPMEISFGGNVGTIKVRQEVDGLQITTGHLVAFDPSTSVNRVGISVAGSIDSLVIKGNFGAFFTNPNTGQFVPDSYLNAGGPSGTIGSLKISGNLNANVYAQGELKSATINGDLLGSITTNGATRGLALGTLHVLGGVRDGSLVLDGSVGSIIIGGTFGTATGTLNIAGNANLIEVGANRNDRNAQLALALNVGGTLKSLVVFGSISGSVKTGLDLTKLTVTNTGATPNAITGTLTVGGRLGNAQIINGNVTSNILVTNNINSFTILRGDLNANATLESLVGSITSFKILGGLAYGDFGSVLALNGTNMNVDISGNLGDGVNAAQIIGDSETSLRVRGNVATNTSIAITAYLNLLRVDGSIAAGATISAHPLKKQKITGINSGTIVAV